MARASSPRVLIVGGGIGGLAAAAGLRAAGVDAVVFERAKEIEQVQVGSGIQVRNNGMMALKRLDLLEQARAAGQVIEWYRFRTAGGALLCEWPVGAFGREYGAPTVGIGRDALHQVLASALDAETIQFGAAGDGFVEDSDGVTVRFADGREERGEALIGADGIKSRVRGQLFPAAAPRYAGFTVWRTVVDFRHERLPEDAFTMWYGRGRWFAAYYLRPGRLYWYAASRAPEGGQDPENSRKEMLLQLFRGWAEPIEAAIEKADERAIRRADMYGLLRLDRWGDGRVTLLGDAAHPMPLTQGQGASQALEDAVVLAQCFRDGGDVPHALRAYEKRRIARASDVALSASQLARRLQIPNPAACVVRSLIIRFRAKQNWGEQVKLLTCDL
jgi:2-polyprenyl-6-methoxyphenol hydroxylase-like FAD-dependent oxidoreductase